MSFFNSILEKLGMSGTARAAPAAAPASASPPQSTAGAAPRAAPQAPPAPAAPVDVTAHLDKLAAAASQKLNWKTSIVDLLKLLGLDSSIGARKELAAELGCPADKMADSAQMNMWLHKAVMQKLAQNGGNVPQELLR
jgi:hypothetical protein